MEPMFQVNQTNQPPAEAADPTCVNTKLLGHVKIADFARTIPVLI